MGDGGIFGMTDFGVQQIQNTVRQSAPNRRKFLQAALGCASGAIWASPLGLMGCAGSSATAAIARPCRAKYSTVAHEILDIELPHNPTAKPYLILDAIIDQARNTIIFPEHFAAHHAASATAVLSQIGQMLESLQFEFKENRLLGRGLIRKQIDCDCYSLIYLAIAETMGLPLKMVRAPAHTFIRWHLSPSKYINWETTINDLKDDRYYVTQHQISKRSRGLSALRSLDIHRHRGEIHATAFVSSGTEWLKRCRFKEAIDSFRTGIKRDPLYETPYYNLGLVYYLNGRLEDAVMWVKLTLNLNPNHIKSHILLMNIYGRNNDATRASKHYERVHRLDPTYFSPNAMSQRRKHRRSCA